MRTFGNLFLVERFNSLLDYLKYGFRKVAVVPIFSYYYIKNAYINLKKLILDPKKSDKKLGGKSSVFSYASDSEFELDSSQR